jgi:methionyl-tRNA formyltransferase
MIRVIFFGSPDFAVPSLHALAHDERFIIEAIVTQPDKPKGRGRTLQQTPIAQIAARLGFAVVKTERPTNESATIQSFKNIDVFVVVAYGAMLPASILALPKYGTINLHPSLLPKYRGASPIQAAILNGDHETGVSVMLLDEGLDHGPLLWQESVPIEHHDTAESLSQRLAGIGAKLLATTIPLRVKGELIPQPQDDTQATFTKQLTKENGKIDWMKPVDHIARMVRAYHPWPSTWTHYREKDEDCLLKITEAAVLHQPHTSPPGTLIQLSDASIAVACSQGSLLKLITVQPSGKNAIPVEAFINGHRNVIGTILNNAADL